MFTSITKTRVNNEALPQLSVPATHVAAAADEHVRMSLLCGLIAAIAATIDFQLKRQQHSFILLLCLISTQQGLVSHSLPLFSLPL